MSTSSKRITEMDQQKAFQCGTWGFRVWVLPHCSVTFEEPCPVLSLQFWVWKPGEFSSIAVLCWKRSHHLAAHSYCPDCMFSLFCGHESTLTVESAGQLFISCIKIYCLVIMMSLLSLSYTHGPLKSCISVAWHCLIFENIEITCV